MSVQASVTRTLLSLSDLTLAGSTFNVAEKPVFDSGHVTWRRENVTSPFVSGDFEVGAVPDKAAITMAVRVTSTSDAALSSALGTLLAAFTQKTFTLTATIGAASYSWACRRADYGPVTFDQTLRGHRTAMVPLSIPRSPVPVSGPV